MNDGRDAEPPGKRALGIESVTQCIVLCCWPAPERSACSPFTLFPLKRRPIVVFRKHDRGCSPCLVPVPWPKP